MPITDALGVQSRIACNGAVRRQFKSWGGLAAEIVHYPVSAPFEFTFSGTTHFLAVGEAGHRADGETSIDGLIPSRRRTLGGAMVFVPPGSRLNGWSVPKLGSAWLNLYIAPSLAAADSNRMAPGVSPSPRLHFSDTAVQATVAKIRRLLDRDDGQAKLYAETLGTLLMIELLRSGTDARVKEPMRQGGLSASHERLLCDFIRAHMAEDISLRRLAELVDLSPFHLARTFRCSIGMPPHSYLNRMRINKAKEMLSTRHHSITEIALAVGFANSGHFATTFRRLTGRTPRDFRRALD